MLSTRDFNGDEYHAFCQQQYDNARRFLKTCGKPKDEIDRFLIEKHRMDASIFGGALDRTKAVKLLQLKSELKNKSDVLKKQFILIEKFLNADGGGV